MKACRELLTKKSKDTNEPSFEISTGVHQNGTPIVAFFYPIHKLHLCPQNVPKLQDREPSVCR